MSIKDTLKRIDEKKKRVDAFHPLPLELVTNLQEWLAVNFIYETNALEGNSLSHMETAIVIGGKTLHEHIELIDCARAVTFITERARNKKNISADDILILYKFTSEKIDPSLDLVDFMQWLHSAADHPIIVAALAHYKLVTIHPFIDGNGLPFVLRQAQDERRAKEGRTARLLMNLLLLQHGYPLAIIKKEQRPQYIAAIEHARETDDFDQFYEVIISAVEYSLDMYLEAIEGSNL
ncbi:MAG TPA: Fic family protein [Candidatus Babeliales bacterium]|jgi:Fic family protein|nr:Fic family protein [Candidatus Babeliales bacterium]